jgi:acetylornithine/N-succinyldiaminopimelate aminotransferase
MGIGAIASSTRLAVKNVTPYLPVYRRFDIAIARGEGSYLYSDCGKRILDFATGIAVNSFGHNHPHLVDALKTQAGTLWHCSNMYHIPELERFASRLVEASFADSVFFCSSGAEAVEAGLKFMRRVHYARGDAHKTDVIVMDGGFHGRTYGGISAGGNEAARAGFGGLLPGFDRVAFNDISALQNAISKQTAGVLLEPVQGEGGVRAVCIDYLKQLRALCDQHGILLMCDEVQCGYGRPGSLFAHERAGITPDIVSAAKGIGGGFPLGATLVSDAVASSLSPGCHGSTYGSNPLAMAVGNAVLDLMLAEGFLPSVQQKGDLLLAKLQKIQQQFPQHIKAVRGVGLFIGLVPMGNGRDLSQALLHAGLATAPSVSNVVRILPPLNVSLGEIDEAISIIETTLKTYQNGGA